jgi:hypothetical protein
VPESKVPDDGTLLAPRDVLRVIREEAATDVLLVADEEHIVIHTYKEKRYRCKRCRRPSLKQRAPHLWFGVGV